MASSTTLVSPSSSAHIQETQQQQFGYFPTNHLVVEKHETNMRCVTNLTIVT